MGADLGLGLRIGGTVSYLPSLSPVTMALFGAEIDKAYLRWLDISKLLAAFPQHVKDLGDTVTFQGPVAIVSSMGPIRRLFAQCVLGIASSGLLYLFLESINKLGLKALFLKAIDSNARLRRFYYFHLTIDKREITICKVAFYLLAAGVGSYLAGRYLLPTQAGIYFFRQPPFHA